MRDHSNHICLQRDDAVRQVLSKVSFEPRVEHVLTAEALGRVLAEDAVCEIDLPNALCSRMDAIGVHWADFEGGMPDVSGWTEGVEYCFANTGTAIGGDYDTCIRIESVEFDEDGNIKAITQMPSGRGDMTIAPGSRHHVGEKILERGARLTPTKLTALALAGIAEVAVVSRPRVLFIPTGDELVPLGFNLPDGKTYEANSIMVANKLREWGADPHVSPILGDDWGSIRREILQAVEEYDIVVLNAGSSKGSKDFNMEILEQEGEVICHEVNHGPGRHTSYSIVRDVPVVGIAGPPAGAEYTADWYLKPLVDTYLYGHPAPRKMVKACLAHDLPYREFGPQPIPMFGARRGILHRADDGGWLVDVIGMGSKPELVHEDEANCFLSIYVDLEGAPTGTEVEVELRYPYRYPDAPEA